jgi:hypothetical protein
MLEAAYPRLGRTAIRGTFLAAVPSSGSNFKINSKKLFNKWHKG